MKKQWVSAIGAVVLGFGHASAVEISEDYLKALSLKGSPKLESIQASFYEARSNELESLDSLETEAFVGYKYTDTKERAMISFMPVFSPTNSYQAGLRKKFSYGLSAELKGETLLQSGKSEFEGTYKDITTTIFSFTVNLDLWKDLFGKLTKAGLENARLMKEKAKIEEEISTKAFEVALRRLYWSLVANQEKMLISEKLYDTATRQAGDSRQRAKNSIADKSEVARYEAQVASRKGSIIYLKYQRESILKELRNLLPELSDKEITLGKYNLSKTVFQVLECTNKISSERSTPFNYTKYDEMTKLLKEVQKNQKKMDESYNDIDVKLSLAVKETGVASEEKETNFYEGSYSESLDDINDNDRSGFEAGLSIVIPIGGKKSETAEVKKIYHEKLLNSQIDEMDVNVANTHQEISRSISLLTEVIKAQKTNSEKLNLRLSEMRKKYNQARISVSELIQDQDAQMNADLSIVDTQLAVVNTLLDYLVIFTDTPCSFNKVNL